MKKPAPHPREAARQAALRASGPREGEREEALDDLVFLAAQICGAPIALVSIVDGERQWFKARVGLDATETSRDISFCGHAIHGTEIFMVPDATQDARFADNPLVTDDPAIRMYAGAPIFGGQPLPLGTLCVIDREARALDDDQQRALRILARRVDDVLVLQQRNRELADALETLSLVRGILPMCASCKKVRDGDGWTPIDQFVVDHSDASVSHGLCPTCAQTLYPEYL